MDSECVIQVLVVFMHHYMNMCVNGKVWRNERHGEKKTSEMLLDNFASGHIGISVSEMIVHKIEGCGQTR